MLLLWPLALAVISTLFPCTARCAEQRLEISTAALPPQVPTKRDVVGVDDISKGAVGRCYTVFEGNEVEPFAFVVKGIMRDYLGPKGDLVLVRLLGDKVNFTGVVAGMSGSPCFIGEKLVGALSYAFAPFAKEPIAGITPMAAMDKVMAAPVVKLPWRLDEPGDAQAYLPTRQQTSAGDGLEPIASPVAVGGCSEAIRRRFSEDFAAFGLGPLVGTSRAQTSATSPLKAGGPIAVVLMRGDMDMAATGTVTWVDGNRVLAFGHPFMGGGTVSLPMAQATILNTMVSAQRSFKMAATGPAVGEITQDRLMAIGGVLGHVPKLLPIDGHVVVDKVTHPFHLEVARDLAYTPKLVAMGLAGALSGRVEATARGTVRVTGHLAIAHEKPVLIHAVLAAEHDDGLLTQAAMTVAQHVAVLWDTPFGRIDEAKLSVNVTIEPEPIIETIEQVSLAPMHVRPGETLEVAVRLRRRGVGVLTELLHLPILPDWAGQTIELAAAGGDEAQVIMREVDGAPHLQSRRDIISYLGRHKQQGHVHLLALRKGLGVVRAVDHFAFVPPSAATLLTAEPGTHLRHQGVISEQAAARPGTVSGLVKKTFVVAQHR